MALLATLADVPWRARRTICVLLPLALVAMSASEVAAQLSRARSVGDVRPRIPDELDRPARRQTSSHRGWEYRADQFTIVATTSQADARWAAAEVAKVRTEMADLADRFTHVHRAADFGLNSLQVVIDDRPPRDRDAPPATVNVIGLQTQVVIHVSPGQPPLAEQLPRLRAGAALALLHAAELDRALPDWVIDGLAGHVAFDKLPVADESVPTRAGVHPPLGGRQWREARVAQDRLSSTPQDVSAAASQVRFLLTGDDAAYAPEFFAAIRAAVQQGQFAAAGTVSRRRGEIVPPAAAGQLDALFAAHQSRYAAWLNDPQIGQPEFESDPTLAGDVLAIERDMLVVLKLQRKIERQDRRSPAIKIATFDRGQGKSIVGGPEFNEPPPIGELAARLRDQSQPPLATLDAEGRLLLSTDRERIVQLLGSGGDRYSQVRRDNHWALATQLLDGRTLEGRLAPHPQQPSRLVATFAIVERPAARTIER